jgi:hypothetical protein
VDLGEQEYENEKQEMAGQYVVFQVAWADEVEVWASPAISTTIHHSPFTIHHLFRDSCYVSGFVWLCGYS